MSLVERVMVSLEDHKVKANALYSMRLIESKIKEREGQ